MELKFFGQFCFMLAQGEAQIIINPRPGLKKEAVAILFSEQEPDWANQASQLALVVAGPGEYERQGVFIQGIASKASSGANYNTIYRIEFGEIAIGHLGNLGQKSLSQSQLEQIGNIDILLAPFATGVLSVAEASQIINMIEPSLVIPMGQDLTAPGQEKQVLKQFLEEIGSSAEPEPKLKIKRQDLSERDLQVKVLSISK